MSYNLEDACEKAVFLAEEKGHEMKPFKDGEFWTFFECKKCHLNVAVRKRDLLIKGDALHETC